jgi:hypothetical protein
MLLIGYCLKARSEHRLYKEWDLNFACRGFGLLDLIDRVQDYSTFSKNRQG